MVPSQKCLAIIFDVKNQSKFRRRSSLRIVDSSNFPAASTIAAALVEVEPGGMREMHWHPNNDEWQYYISGKCPHDCFASASGKARTFDYQAGDVGYIPFAMGHYVENIGDEPLRFLEIFRSSYFADVSLNQWMALTPPELVQAHLNLDQTTYESVAQGKTSYCRRNQKGQMRGRLTNRHDTASFFSTIL